METIWLNGVEGIILDNGKWVPIFKGGSGLDTLVQGESTDEDDGENWDDDEDLDDDDDDDDDIEQSLADGFLQGIPDEHKELLAPYVKKWDAGVTRRFQELHSQYAPYQELGDIEQIQQAMEVMHYLQESPEELYQLLHEQYGEQGLQEPVPSQGHSDFQGQLPPEVVEKLERLDQLQSVVELLAQNHLEGQRSEQEAAEDAALDEYLSNLKEEFGDFDEDWVLTKMQAGMDGEKAVKAFHRFQQDLINQALEAQQNVPTLLSGGGSSSGGEQQQKLGDIPNKDLQGFVAGLLAQANNA